MDRQSTIGGSIMALKGTKFKHYSIELKLKAVKLYEDGNGSKKNPFYNS